MKLILVPALFLTTALSLHADNAPQLTDEKSRISYAIGMMLGQNFFKRNNLDTNSVDMDVVAQAMKTVQTDGTPLMTALEMQTTIKDFQQKMMAKQKAVLAQEAAKDKADGLAFLSANKNNPGVITLPDGLQYQVITNGTGAVPGPNDQVSVNYRGTLVNGQEFDSSYRRGQPAQFPVNGVIHGWTEALEKMPVGSKWKLFIPSELAYGDMPRPGIPPNSVLIFEVELLSIKSQPQPEPQTSDIIKVPSAEGMKRGEKIEVINAKTAAAEASQASAH